VVEPTQIIVHSTLTDAIEQLKSATGSIVLIDDNIASGTQASRQLGIFMGESAEKPDGNYSLERLSEANIDALRKKPIGASFSVGHDDGRETLARKAAELGIMLPLANITYGKSIIESSGKTKISNALRGFMQHVGECVLKRRFEREEIDDPQKTAKAFALGYGGFESLIATSFSVPTSTYPAFWCPGVKETILPDGEVLEAPWLPLFIRTNMLEHLVLG
jgi:hypothetical protein